MDNHKYNGELKAVLTGYDAAIAKNKAACHSEYGFKAYQHKSVPFLKPKQAAVALRVSVKTLSRWRAAKDGPVFVKMGKQIRYAIIDLEKWIKAQSSDQDTKSADMVAGDSGGLTGAKVSI